MFRLLSNFPQRENMFLPSNRKFFRVESNSVYIPICLSWVWLETELDGTKFFYQLIKSMAEFQIERHRLYVSIEKNN